MKAVIGNDFCEVEKYKLYRTVYEILHPTISKKNISNYKVVVDEKMLPILVFYPKRVSDINSVIIFIPGKGNVSGSYGKYSDICKRLAKESDKLVIAIDYFGSNMRYPTTSNKVFKIVNYLYEEFKKINIGSESITLMGDSTGCGILGEVLVKLNDKNKSVNKMIFLYPVVRSDYSGYNWNEACVNLNFNLDKRLASYLKKYFSKGETSSLLEMNIFENFPKTMIITGDMDILKYDGEELAKKLDSEYRNIKFASHGFLSCDDEEILMETYKEISAFVN